MLYPRPRVQLSRSTPTPSVQTPSPCCISALSSVGFFFFLQRCRVGNALTATNQWAVGDLSNQQTSSFPNFACRFDLVFWRTGNQSACRCLILLLSGLSRSIILLGWFLSVIVCLGSIQWAVRSISIASYDRKLFSIELIVICRGPANTYYWLLWFNGKGFNILGWISIVTCGFLWIHPIIFSACVLLGPTWIKHEQWNQHIECWLFIAAVFFSTFW